MKTLVVYYSFEGNCRLIAEAVARETGGELLELKPKKEIKAGGLSKYLWGGKQAMMGEMPELEPWDKDPAGYDLLFIGTPVWAWTFAPALRSFFARAGLSGKKIALFCCHGGQPARTFEKMRQPLAGNEILGEADFLEPLKVGKEAKAGRAREWAAEMVRKAGTKEEK